MPRLSLSPPEVIVARGCKVLGKPLPFRRLSAFLFASSCCKDRFRNPVAQSDELPSAEQDLTRGDWGKLPSRGARHSDQASWHNSN
jgi:hypothetical protein